MNFKLYGDYLVNHIDWVAYKGKEVKRYGAGLVYYEMTDMKCIEGLVHHLKPDSVRLVEVTTENLRPHRDHGITAALNLYLEPAGAVTTFYKVKEGQSPYRYPGETIAAVYAMHQLEVMDSFVAKKGEAYGLDVSQVHTVTGASGTRRFVQLSWCDKPFAEVMADR